MMKWMRTLVAVLALVAVPATVSAQEAEYERSQLGVGLGTVAGFAPLLVHYDLSPTMAAQVALGWGVGARGMFYRDLVDLPDVITGQYLWAGGGVGFTGGFAAQGGAGIQSDLRAWGVDIPVLFFLDLGVGLPIFSVSGGWAFFF